MHGVKSINRWHWYEYIYLLKQAKILISGGGGLFQDRTSFLCVPYYASQIFLAKLLGTKVLVYAQGLGPLNTLVGRKLTEIAMEQAQTITLRDNNSLAMLKSWQLEGELTSDPVWMLSPSPLPESLSELLDNLRSIPNNRPKIIGLSLRNHSALKDYHLEFLAQAMAERFSGSTIMLLPFQPEQDLSPLQKANEYLQKLGLKTHTIDSALLTKPSQWLALIQNLDLIIGMRLHALLMAIQAGKPVIGIAYDPKVSILLNDFRQPLLSLDVPDRESVKIQWLKIINEANVDGLNEYAKEKLACIKQQASQNSGQLKRALKG